MKTNKGEMQLGTPSRGVQISREILERYRENEEVLIGTLLGSASMQTYSDGNTWRLRYLQKDEKYLRHLYELWEPFTGTGPKQSKDRDGNERWSFNTQTFSGFTKIAKEYYGKNEKGVWVKRVPMGVQLTPKALAYWYMDDGSKKSNAKAYYLCTDGFTIEQLGVLRKEMNKQFGIMVNYHRTEKGKIRLYIPTKYNERFIELVNPHIVESFKYKLHYENSR